VAAPTKLVVLAAAAADLQARYLTNQTQTQQPLSFLETLAVLELKVPTGLVVVVVALAELARLRPSTLLVDLVDPGLCQTFLEPQPVMQLAVAVVLDLQRFPVEALAASVRPYRPSRSLAVLEVGVTKTPHMEQKTPGLVVEVGVTTTASLRKTLPPEAVVQV
jgi:hypothetical protein